VTHFSDSQSRRVLVVEDDRIAAEALKELIESFGCDVVGIAMTADRGMALAIEQQPDLVCMDIVLKGRGDGIDLATRLRQERQISSIFTTAYFDSQIIERAKAAEPVGYLTKPYDPVLLRCNLEIAFAKIEADRRLHEANARLESLLQEAENSLGKREAELFHARKMEAIGRLSGGVAHDFNNILVPILSYSRLLMEGLDDRPELQEMASVINGAGHDAQGVIRQLLAFSSREEGDKAFLDLNEVVREASTLVESGIGGARTVTWEFERGGLRALLEKAQVSSIVLNLCLNASHATREGGTICARTGRGVVGALPADMNIQPSQEWIHLAVQDSGVGMSANSLKRAFDPFFSTKGAEGTGLGLSMVHGAAKSHGGFVTIDSVMGQGTLVAVHFPSAPRGNSDSDPPTPAPPCAEPHGKGARILVIEDQELVAKLAKRALERFGYEVEVAMTLAEARSSLQVAAGLYDLVLADCLLPDGHITELLDDLETRISLPPVILSSGYAGRISLQQLASGRGYSFLQKPYELANLRDAVAKQLGEHRKD